MNSSVSLTQHNLGAGTYNFSAMDLDDLGATEYTLVTIAVDKSGSVCNYEKDMEACIKKIIESCKTSPRKDNLMIRLVIFNQIMEEVHGFKLLPQCNLSDYDGCLNTSGTTALVDTTENVIAATNAYATTLVDDGDYAVNAVVFVITDGMDNSSSSTTADIKKALDQCKNDERLESIVSILIGVGIGSGGQTTTYLTEFKNETEMNHFEPIDTADAKTLAKLAQWVSQSVSSQSQALGSGAASQLLQF